MKTVVFISLSIFIFEVLGEGDVSYECVMCICRAATNCQANTGCNGEFCGPFQLSKNFWIDGGRPTVIRIEADEDPLSFYAYRNCISDMDCAAATLNNYLEKYKRDSNGDGKINCDDFVLIYLHGPIESEDKDFNAESKSPFVQNYLNCKSKFKRNI